MRIAIDARPLQSGSRLRGIGTYTRSLIQNLLDNGNDLTLIVWGGTEHAFAASNQQIFPVPQPRIRVLGFVNDRFFHQQFFLNLADKVDIIHFTSPFELDLSWPGIDVGIPRIMTVYDLMPLTHSDLILEGKHKLLKPVYTAQSEWLSSADGIISISNATTKAIQENLHNLPTIKTVPCGVATNLGRPGDQTIASFKAKYKLPETFVLYFGGLSKNKNVSRLLEVFSEQELPTLVVAGASSLASVNALRKQHPKAKVMWLGRIAAPDVASLYAAATLVVMPSLVEGFGLPVVEAMACGTPVACSNVSSLPEVVGPAAETFDPTNIIEMRTVIKKLLDSPARLQELRELGKTRAKELNFSKTSTQTYLAYEEFIREYTAKHSISS